MGDSSLHRFASDAIKSAAKAHDNLGVDFGGTPPVTGHDARADDKALKIGARFLSAYRPEDGTKIWVITEADRAATTMLLPDEY